MEVLRNLNDLQRQAALHNQGPLLVLAGPGTGKTRILVERVRRMIEEGTPPEEVCLVTFTTKAADEIKHRLSRDIGKETVEHLNASTLHSLALRIMIANERKHDRRIPEIADSVECFGYLRRAIQEIDVNTELSSVGEIWQTLCWYKTSEKRDLSLLNLSDQTIIKRYDQILQSENKWDLSDLILHASSVLRNESDIAAAFSTLRHLMVDEFQDTSMAEYTFLKLLLGENQNLMMVAAAAQSIYSWRGANFKRLQTLLRKDFPDFKTIILRENYRCGQNIIELAAAMTPEEDEVRLNGNRGDGQVLWKELPDNYAEANFVANTILKLQDLGAALPNIAILMRTWRQSNAIEQALVESTIPYTLFSDKKKFYERKEIQEMVAYVQAIKALMDYNIGLMAAPVMNGAIDQIINTPPRGIGPRSAKMIRANATEITVDCLVRAMARQDLREQVRHAAFDLFTLLNNYAKAEIKRPAELIGKIMAETDWIKTLQGELEGHQAISRIKTLQEEASGFLSLNAFLDAMSKKVSFKMDKQGVALTTIHGAKGLEWPIVFVVGFVEGELPSYISLREVAGGDTVEERHVAHVAFSRARDVLFVSWYKNRIYENGKVRSTNRSSFVSKIPEEVWREYCEQDFQIRDDDEVLETDYAANETAFEAYFG